MPESVQLTSQLVLAIHQYLNRQPMCDVRQMVLRLEQELAEAQAAAARAQPSHEPKES